MQPREDSLRITRGRAVALLLPVTGLLVLPPEMHLLPVTRPLETLRGWQLALMLVLMLVSRLALGLRRHHLRHLLLMA
jgi:hypothetical protein